MAVTNKTMRRAPISGLHLARIFGVYCILLVFLIFNLVDLPLFGRDGERLSFLLIALYFWTVYHPRLLPFPVIFLAGLMLDFLSGGMVGLNAFCFMVVAMIVRGQRRYLLGQSWPVVWAGFSVAALVVCGFQYLAYSLGEWTFSPLLPILLNWVISSLLYPLIYPALLLVSRFLSD